MAHSVRRHLRLDISAFDAMIRRFIPGYETMLSEVAGRVAAVLPDQVVDLGAGTGALTEELLQRAGVGHVRCLDIDPEMLDQARSRLEGLEGRVTFVRGSFRDPLPEADAFATSLSLHHIGTIEEKLDLFARAYEALRPGGVLVNGDANMPEASEERDRLYRTWVDHMIHNGIDEERAWRNLDDWAEEDTYLPLDDELAALVDVGFDASVTWRLGPINVVVARRPLI